MHLMLTLTLRPVATASSHPLAGKWGDCAAALNKRLSAMCLATALQVVYDMCFCTSVRRLDG